VQLRGFDELSRVIYFCTQFGKIVGDVCNMYASRRFGRLRCLQAGFVVCALSTLGLVFPPSARSGAIAWLLVLAFVQGLGMDVLWCNLYIYLVERFPTTVRSTGFGVSMGIGRAGGVFSSAMGNLLPSMTAAFGAYAASFGVGALVALRPAVETAKRSLVDVARADGGEGG